MFLHTEMFRGDIGKETERIRDTWTERRREGGRERDACPLPHRHTHARTHAHPYRVDQMYQCVYNNNIT